MLSKDSHVSGLGEKKTDPNKKGYRHFCQVTWSHSDEIPLQSKARALQVFPAGDLLPPSGDAGNWSFDFFFFLQSRSYFLGGCICFSVLCKCVFAEVWRNARPQSENFIQLMLNPSNHRDFYFLGRRCLLKLREPTVLVPISWEAKLTIPSVLAALD